MFSSNSSSSSLSCYADVVHSFWQINSDLHLHDNFALAQPHLVVEHGVLIFAQLQRIISNTSAGAMCIPSGMVISERLLESSSFTQPYLEGSIDGGLGNDTWIKASY